MREIANITALQEVLHEIHKDVALTSSTIQTGAQQLHSAKTNFLPLNIIVGDNVVVQVSARKEHKLQTKCHEPMRVNKARSSLVLVVEEVINGELVTMHAQQMV